MSSKLRSRLRPRVRVRLRVQAGRPRTRISVCAPLLGLLLGVRERVERRVGVRVFSLSSTSSSRSSSNSTLSTRSTSSSRRSRPNSNSTERATLGPFLRPSGAYENQADSNELTQFSNCSTTFWSPRVPYPLGHHPPHGQSSHRASISSAPTPRKSPEEGRETTKWTAQERANMPKPRPSPRAR